MSGWDPQADIEDLAAELEQLDAAGGPVLLSTRERAYIALGDAERDLVARESASNRRWALAAVAVIVLFLVWVLDEVTDVPAPPVVTVPPAVYQHPDQVVSG